MAPDVSFDLSKIGAVKLRLRRWHTITRERILRTAILHNLSHESLLQYIRANENTVRPSEIAAYLCLADISGVTPALCDLNSPDTAPPRLKHLVQYVQGKASAWHANYYYTMVLDEGWQLPDHISSSQDSPKNSPSKPSRKRGNTDIHQSGQKDKRMRVAEKPMLTGGSSIIRPWHSAGAWAVGRIVLKGHTDCVAVAFLDAKGCVQVTHAEDDCKQAMPATLSLTNGHVECYVMFEGMTFSSFRHFISFASLAPGSILATVNNALWWAECAYEQDPIKSQPDKLHIGDAVDDPVPMWFKSPRGNIPSDYELQGVLEQAGKARLVEPQVVPEIAEGQRLVIGCVVAYLPLTSSVVVLKNLAWTAAELHAIESVVGVDVDINDAKQILFLPDFENAQEHLETQNSWLEEVDPRVGWRPILERVERECHIEVGCTPEYYSVETAMKVVFDEFVQSSSSLEHQQPKPGPDSALQSRSLSSSTSQQSITASTDRGEMVDVGNEPSRSVPQVTSNTEANMGSPPGDPHYATNTRHPVTNYVAPSSNSSHILETGLGGQRHPSNTEEPQPPQNATRGAPGAANSVTAADSGVAKPGTRGSSGAAPSSSVDTFVPGPPARESFPWIHKVFVASGDGQPRAIKHKGRESLLRELQSCWPDTFGELDATRCGLVGSAVCWARVSVFFDQVPNFITSFLGEYDKLGADAVNAIVDRALRDGLCYRDDAPPV